MRRRRTRMRAATLMLAAALLTAAGCGGSGGATTPAQREAAEKERAISSLLKDTDMGEEFEVDGSAMAYAGAQLARMRAQDPALSLTGTGTMLNDPCIRSAGGEPGLVAAASAPKLTVPPDRAFILNQVFVYATERQAQAAAEIFTYDASHDCLAAVAERTMRRLTRRQRLTVAPGLARTLELPEVGDSRFAFLVEVPMSKGTTRESYYGEYIVVQTGRALNVTLTTAVAPPPDEAREFIAERVADRLEDHYG